MAYDYDDVSFKQKIFKLVDEKRFTELHYYLPKLPDPFVNEIGDTILHRICRSCCSGSEYVTYYPFLNYILSEYPHYITTLNLNGETPLNVACKTAACVELITKLVDLDPSIINQPDNNGCIPLQSYICNVTPHSIPESPRFLQMQVLQIIELLIRKGSNINHENNDNKNSLMCSLFRVLNPYSHTILLDVNLILIENGSNIFSSNGLYHIFKKIEHISYVNFKKIITLNKLDVNKLDSYRYTPLHWLILDPRNPNASRLIELMYENGAQIEPQTDIIKLARDEKCDFKIIEVLLKYNPHYDVNTQNSNGQTLILEYGTEYSIIKKLLELGANPSITDKYGYNILINITEATACDYKTVMLLLQYGANPMMHRKCNMVSFRNYVSNKPEWQELLQLLLSIPALKQIPLQENAKAFYITLITNITSYYLSSCKEMEYANQFVVNNSLEMLIENNRTVLNLEFPLFDQYIDINCDTPILEPIGYVIAAYKGMASDTLENVINIMLRLGFRLDNIPSHVVTPLTILVLYHLSPYDRVHTNPNFLKIFNYLKDKGININSKVLDNYENYVNLKLRVRNFELKIENDVPDVLYLAVVKKDYDIVKLLLPNWWGSPLGLLSFFPLQEYGVEKYKILFTIWIPYLLSYGGIPRGTSLELELRRLMECWRRAIVEYNDHNNQYENVWDQLCEVMDKPSTIEDFCKYSIRRKLATSRAFLAGRSLPELIQELQDVPLPKAICDMITH